MNPEVHIISRLIITVALAGNSLIPPSLGRSPIGTGPTEPGGIPLSRPELSQQKVSLILGSQLQMWLDLWNAQGPSVIEVNCDVDASAVRRTFGTVKPTEEQLDDYWSNTQAILAKQRETNRSYLTGIGCHTYISRGKAVVGPHIVDIYGRTYLPSKDGSLQEVFFSKDGKLLNSNSRQSFK